MATLVPCLDALRSEFNRNFPQRDKVSDGWIGDPAHQNTNSDHNPDGSGVVHAIDVDRDLRMPGTTLAECVNVVVDRHRRGADSRLTYVIYERTIWSASYDWRPRNYSGSNPHDKHAHFSAKRGANSRAPFGVEDIVTQADRDDIVNRVLAGVWTRVDQRVDALLVELRGQLPDWVWAHLLRNPYSDTDQPAGTILRYAPSRQPTLDVGIKVDAVAADVAEIKRMVGDLPRTEG